MRGAQQGEIKSTVAERIIPAYAGSTYVGQLVQPPEGDHPRVCGEHLSLNSLWASVRGSSPRMRGAHGRLHIH